MSKLIQRFAPWIIDRTNVENYPIIGRAYPQAAGNNQAK